MLDLKTIYQKVFAWLFMGLFATGLVSVYTYSSGLAETLLSSSSSLFIVMIFELLVVLLFSFLFKKLSPAVVGILYFVYAVVNGVALSTIFYAFSINSIILSFFASAILFGVFAIIGRFTKTDLSKWQTLFFGTLIVGIIVSVINLFIGNNLLNIIVSWVLLLTFFGITAYDMQNIKNLANSGTLDNEKIHIYGAMQLYLDFINIFIRILNIFGRRN